MPNNRIRNSNRGFNLLETVVAGGIMSGFLLSVLMALQTVTKGRQSMKWETQLEEIRYFIRNHFDCYQTAYQNGVLCTENAAVDLYEATSHSPFALANGSKEMVWGIQLKGTCLAQGIHRAIKIDYAIPAKTPGARTPEWKDLFDGMPMSCKNPGISPTTPPVQQIPCGGAIVRTTATIPRAQFAALLGSRGFPANGELLADGYHASLVCNAAGYIQADSIDTGDPDSMRLCATKVIAARRVSVPGGWQTTPVCNSNKIITNVHCEDKFPCDGWQNNTCQPRLGITAASFNYFPLNFLASRVDSVPIYNFGNNRCLTIANRFENLEDCPNVRRDNSTLDKLCDMMGYDNVESSSYDDYSSPRDNSVMYWDGSAWRRQGRPPGHVDTLYCDQPRYPDCLNWK